MLFINVRYRHYLLIMLPLDNFNKISCWPDTAVVLDFCNKIKSSYSCVWSPALNVLVKRWLDRLSCHSSGACTAVTTGGCVFLFCNPISPSLALPEIGTVQTGTFCAAAERAAADQVHHGAAVALLASGLLQPMVQVKSNSSLQTCMRAGALLTGRGR